jgi:hypothetical protein
MQHLGVQAKIGRLKGLRLKAKRFGTLDSDLRPEPLQPIYLGRSELRPNEKMVDYCSTPNVYTSGGIDK